MKTACTQLKERLLEIGFAGVEDFVNTYIEIEKKQITDAFIEGDSSIFLDSIEDSADNYYNSKFKS